MKAAAMCAILLLGLLVAGCAQEPDRQQPFAEAQRATAAAARAVLALDHDVEGGHHDASLHQGSYNMELVGYSNGVDDTGAPDHIPIHGAYNEIALHGDYAYLSRTSSDGIFGGFSVIDIRDPAHPHVVGQFQAQGGGDIEVSDDGTHVFLTTQRNSPDQVAGALQRTKSPESGLPRGIYVVNVTEPANPRLDTFVPLPYNGPHTIAYFRHPNGSEYIVACTYDLVSDPVTGAIAGAVPVTQRLVAYLVASNPVGSAVPGLPRVALLPVAQFQLPSPGPDRLIFPHDANVSIHPDGRVLITVAYWDLGVRILDFSNPPQATAAGAQLPTLPEIGRFTDFAPSAYNNLHAAKPFGESLRDGNGTEHHVTVAEPEIINADHETGQITFLSTTDPTKPTKLSWWTLPKQDPPLGVTGLDFSPHNFDTWDGKLALTHYHGGVWVIDLSTPENLAQPKEVGFYMPAKARTDSPVPQPYAWSLRARDGLLYVSDEASGLYVLRYTGP